MKDLENELRDALKKEADKVHPANALPIIRKRIKMAKKTEKTEPEWMREGREFAEMQARMRMDRTQIEVRNALSHTPITLIKESPRIPIDWSK